jgi:pyruvate/2-oxoglutarate/acetoin dehydrogenase E1 component
MGKYFDELKRAMDWLGEKDDTIFMGQAVTYAGTAMTNTLKDIPANKKLELPVFEEMQTGITVGMALNGSVPVSIYPRWNFLVLGANQLINHLDKIDIMSNGTYKTKAIIRTSIGSERPFHPQHQHVGDFSEAFSKMFTNIEVIRLDQTEQIFDSYVKAYERTDGKSTILVEWGDYYNEK